MDNYGKMLIDQMAELFQRNKSVIGKHVRNILKEGELEKNSVWAKFAYTASDDKTYQEVIYHRADAEKDFVGLISFSGKQPTLREAKIAKNYLDGILTSTGENLLTGNGTVSHLQTMEKA